MVLSFFSEDLPKASRDKTKNNNIQMKLMMADSFEAQKERKMTKREINKENGTKMNLKWEINKRKKN